jgi:hypothetical protein
MLELLYTSTKNLTLAPYGSIGFFAYIQAWDAFLFSDGQKLYKVFRDGSQFPIGVPPGGFALGNRVGSRHFWLRDYVPWDGGQCYGADDITGQYEPLQILNPSWTLGTALWAAGNYLDEVQGLYLVRGSYGVISVYRLEDGTLQGTIAPAGVSIWGYDNLAAVRTGQVLAFQAASGDVALLDYVHLQVLWQGKVPPFRAAAYDATNNLIVTVGTDLVLRIYLLTPIPAALSSPEFYPAVTRVSREIGYPVRVRLTAADGEPCPKYVINWSPPNLGFLDKTQSLTDLNGYAWNFYFGPPAATGSETLQAEVVV